MISLLYGKEYLWRCGYQQGPGDRTQTNSRTAGPEARRSDRIRSRIRAHSGSARPKEHKSFCEVRRHAGNLPRRQEGNQCLAARPARGMRTAIDTNVLSAL